MGYGIVGDVHRDSIFLAVEWLVPDLNDTKPGDSIQTTNEKRESPTPKRITQRQQQQIQQRHRHR